MIYLLQLDREQKFFVNGTEVVSASILVPKIKDMIREVDDVYLNTFVFKL